MPGKRLILVDGTALLYRAFFAIPGLSTRSGVPTNAVFGFIRMLRQLGSLWAPTHWAVVFDGGVPAARLERLAQYKAQRPPMPDALRQQVPLALEYLTRAGTAWARLDGEEADDVMASVAAWAAPEAPEILLATADKDFFQVVTDRIRVVGLAGKESSTMGPQEVRSKTGVGPEHIVDWLALTGDAVDNIPGVQGIGPKTAAKLLNAFGSWEDLLARLDEVSNQKTRGAIAAGRDVVERNREIIRLRRDLGSPFAWAAMEVQPPDPAKVLPFFEQMEFIAMAREMQQPDMFASLPRVEGG